MERQDQASIVSTRIALESLCYSSLNFTRTMALAFSADLDNIFGIGDGIDGLERTVKEK